jgi:hypothetical protein
MLKISSTLAKWNPYTCVTLSLRRCQSPDYVHTSRNIDRTATMEDSSNMLCEHSHSFHIQSFLFWCDFKWTTQ